MRFVAICLFFVVVVSVLTETAEARRGRGRRRNVYYSTGYVGGSEVWGDAKTDQEKREAEARYMAKHGIRGHVGPLIGDFEGCGWTGLGCATCVPGGGMRLTGDAQVGNYRVRSWRW